MRTLSWGLEIQMLSGDFERGRDQREGKRKERESRTRLDIL